MTQRISRARTERIVSLAVAYGMDETDARAAVGRIPGSHQWRYADDDIARGLAMVDRDGRPLGG